MIDMLLIAWNEKFIQRTLVYFESISTKGMARIVRVLNLNQYNKNREKYTHVNDKNPHPLKRENKYYIIIFC